jgi:hypothetical protein
MPSGFVHIHRNRLHRRFNLILLLIPPIVFALIVAGVVGAYKTQYLNSIEETSVLGEQAP